MLPLPDFIPAVRTAIPRFQPQPGRPPAPDAQQVLCIEHPANVPLQIAAGPGSGKTTVLVLRALRLVVCDGLLPENIVLTTFTTKAADEIRTRLIEWGLRLLAHLRHHGPAAVQAHIANVDVNRFVTGTLDSICEDAVRTFRAATDPAPVLLEGFAANAIMHRRGLTGTTYNGGLIDPAVGAYLGRFTFDNVPPGNVGELQKAIRPLFDRFSHDLIDLAAFQQIAPDTAARVTVAASYDAYVQELQASNRLDFALLERVFLERLRAGRLQRFLTNVRAVLVDEYQDTNLLQESIYFEIAQRTNASLTVVGDDDQSLYRFRGATVELFRDFASRLPAAIPGVAVQRFDLFNNYRSTPEIVGFFNTFIINDQDFLPARIQPPKPAIAHQLPSNGVPVLGMFRADAPTLATDLADLLWDVFRGNGRNVVGVNGPVTLRAHAQGGDFGDAVLLSHQVNEFSAPFMGQPAKPRLPHFLRAELRARQVSIFNPRGQALRDIDDVQQLVGAMLECIDPGGVRQSAMRMRAVSQQYLLRFRAAYAAFAGTNPTPTVPNGISGFVHAWGQRQPQTAAQWPREWPVLELCFTLLSWFPRLRDDPEGQVHLEAVARAISQSATFSAYRALVLNGAPGPHDTRSVEAAIRDIFIPLAEGEIDVDEEVMPDVPRDRFSMMTIHQAKGLEFPLVIVDISSDLSRNHPKTRFRRFPAAPSSVALAEDDLAAACTVGQLRQQRTALQRSFEDLIRLYYVAYSRPQSALLLIGVDKCLQYQTKIKHVATFWRADETWPWAGPYQGNRPPPLANAIPMELI